MRLDAIVDVPPLGQVTSHQPRKTIVIRRRCIFISRLSFHSNIYYFCRRIQTNPIIAAASFNRVRAIPVEHVSCLHGDRDGIAQWRAWTRLMHSILLRLIRFAQWHNSGDLWMLTGFLKADLRCAFLRP